MEPSARTERVAVDEVRDRLNYLEFLPFIVVRKLNFLKSHSLSLKHKPVHRISYQRISTMLRVLSRGMSLIVPSYDINIK